MPMGVKLPPYFDPVHHEATARMLQDVGVDFLSVINSVGNGLVVDPDKERVVIKPKGGFGGLGGTMIKPVALANVRAFWKLFDGRIPIIGTGGIVSGTDVFEHILCGASAVQIGTALVDEGRRRFSTAGKGTRANSYDGKATPLSRNVAERYRNFDPKSRFPIFFLPLLCPSLYPT